MQSIDLTQAMHVAVVGSVWACFLCTYTVSPEWCERKGTATVQAEVEPTPQDEPEDAPDYATWAGFDFIEDWKLNWIRCETSVE